MVIEMKLFFTFFLVLFLLALSSYGANFKKYKTIVKIAVGYGFTENEAIQEALMEVVKQVYGVNIKAFTQLKHKSIEEMKNDKEGFLSKTTYKKNVREEFKGFIHSYKVLQVKKEQGLYKAKIKAKIKLYNLPFLENDDKINIAIYGFEVKKINLDSSPNYISEMFIDKLIEYFSKSNIFSVLDRRYEKYSEEEFKRIFSKKTRLSERAKFGRKLGADVILTGEINLLKLIEENKNKSMLEWISSKKRIDYIISYSLSALSTGKILSSNIISGSVYFNNEISYELMLSKIFDKVATEIFLYTLIDLYTPEIIWRSGNKVLVNIGRIKTLKGKKFFTIRKQSQQIELKTGLIEIINVYKSVSLGKIESGFPDIGDYLYPFTRNQDREQGYRKSQVEVLERGVKLPWD